jgi:hypothetical protein
MKEINYVENESCWKICPFCKSETYVDVKSCIRCNRFFSEPDTLKWEEKWNESAMIADGRYDSDISLTEREFEFLSKLDSNHCGDFRWRPPGYPEEVNSLLLLGFIRNGFGFNKLVITESGRKAMDLYKGSMRNIEVDMKKKPWWKLW